ncbi:Uncharacterized protein conserved in bacteria [Bordetella ansorpii]|uniref:Uncharacterized protein conserved in bacteria n=1 Tax=Bordetella ansorpii TaxID=288768 RepID=A0A157R0Q8_9BORD|nr:DUF484 family protein [Bordetella ansorpii]SAI51528.1 Uncharacterized protein conserved in bacteria [Bordetella ansorpii]
MTTSSFSPQDIADFLHANPEFPDLHPEVFAAMRVPHPHGTQTISLGERQILTLRERVRDLEWRINEMMRNAATNESIGARITQWSQRLLAERDAQLLPGAIAMGLAEQFDIDHIALRLWNLPGLSADNGYAGAVSADVRTFADSLKTPYCGNDAEFEAAAWLAAKPRSLALVALRPADDTASVGLLVLGSDDPARFDPEMGTAFLESIGQLASAALNRLAEPAG